MSKIDLKPQVKNANKHTPYGLRLLENSVQKDGWLDAQTAAADGEIISGSARLEMAAEKFADVEPIIVHSDGTRPIVVIRDDIPNADHARARRLSVAANKIAQVDFNPDFALLQEWAGEDEQIKKLFSDDEWREGTGEQPETVDAEPQIDRAAELQKKWGTKTGQTWIIGNSGRLFVGAAELAHIDCDFAIYDPPFDWSVQQQENSLSWAIWKNCALMGLHYCMPLASRKDYLHWWIWDAGIARFGGKGYHPTKTCAIVFAFGKKERFNKNACVVIGSNYPPQIVRITHPIQGKEGPHEKPKKLCEYIISLYSSGEETIGDPFAGSGSFAVAALQLKRKYHGAEIDPAMCAVILERMTQIGFSCAEEFASDSHSPRAGKAVGHV